MNRNEFMELVYETFADEPDNVLANGIIEAADAYAEHEKAQLSQEGTTKDTISRQAAIRWVKTECNPYGKPTLDFESGKKVIKHLEQMPPAQPEPTYEQVEEYCKKRCLHVVTADFFESTKPQRLGHWIPHETPDDGEQYECSECGVLWEFNDGTPEDNEAYFCPKCGKKLITK